MGRWFGRKRRLCRTLAAMPAGLDLCPEGGNSLLDSGHKANKLPRPTQKDGRRVTNNKEVPFEWRQASASPTVAHSFTKTRVYHQGPIWNQRFMGPNEPANVRRNPNYMNLSRCLTLLLMSTLIAANYCCCFQMDNRLMNDERSMKQPASNNHVDLPLSKHKDSVRALNVTTTTNGQQINQDVYPCPQKISNRIGLLNSSDNNLKSLELIKTLGSNSHILSTKSPMPSVGMNNIVQPPISTPKPTINGTNLAHNYTNVVASPSDQQVATAVGFIGHNNHIDQLSAQSTQLAPSTISRQLTTAATGDSVEPLVVSASKKKKKMMKKKKKMEKKHKEWKKGKKHKKKKYESKKKKGGSSKKKKGKKEKKKWGMEKKGHKKKGNFKKKKWGKKKKMKKGSKKGKKGHKMLKDKGHKKKGFKKVYHKEEWGKKKKWHDIKREKKWNTKQKKWKKKWHQEKGKKYKGKHMKKYEKKNKHGKKYKKEKKSKWKKHKGEKFKKGHKKKKEEYSKKKEGGKKKKMKKEMKKMKKKKG